jgi:hypothetical protein
MSTARVDFTRGAAERIAAVVRQVEGGNRDGAPLTFRRVGGEGGGKAIRFCSWTATWAYSQTATITFVSGTANTATATNVILGVGPGDGWVAKKGTSGWSLIGFDMTKQPNYSGSAGTQVFTIVSGNMEWADVASCPDDEASPTAKAFFLG